MRYRRYIKFLKEWLDKVAENEEDAVYYLIRPGTIKFLNELSRYYELVIFTAAMPDVRLNDLIFM
jgi:TFIIF-interacting CTD phosphatase-like protein